MSRDTATPRSTGSPRHLDGRQVWILYWRELRSALRERNIVINSLLIPLLLYPFMLWAGFNGIMFVQGQTAGFVSRVAAPAWPEGHEMLRAQLECDTKVDLVPAAGLASADAEARIRAGRLDVFLEFLPAEGVAAGLPGNFRARIVYDKSKERSSDARRRVDDAVRAYREDWLEREAAARGASAADWQVLSVMSRNVASEKQIGAFILGRMLPVLFVVAVALGCFHPAVDTIAGERERGTWETLMSCAAGRTSVAAAKYLYVATMGCVAGIINLAALVATMKPIFAPLIREAGDAISFSVPLAALPVIAVAAVLLSGFVAGGMLLFASFARTFKEGQSMITPFFSVVMIPVLFLQMPGLEFSIPIACVPVANVVMMLRDALTGAFPPVPIAITLVASLAAIAGCIRLAAFILQHEDVVMASQRGSLQTFLKRHLLRRGTNTAPSNG